MWLREWNGYGKDGEVDPYTFSLSTAELSLQAAIAFMLMSRFSTGEGEWN